MSESVSEPAVLPASEAAPEATPEATQPPQSRWARKPRPARTPRPPRAPRKPLEVNGATVVALGLMLLTGLIVAFGCFLFVGSGLAANRNQDVMYDDLQVGLSQATVPVSGVIAPGTALGILDIPRLGLEQVFVQGSASEQTIIGPGLKPDSVLPGQSGVSVLVGRRATFGAPFRQIDQLQPGDRILVTTGQGKFVYVVDLVRTSDAPAVQIEQVPARLTLVTSDPAITPSRTLTVTAQLRGKALPAATGVPAASDNQPGQGSSGRLVALLLWSQLLLLVTGVATWAALKYGVRAIWIGAVPVLLAILWNVFENLAVLLPNTL